MGLGSFRWRLVLVVAAILLLWQTSRIWSTFTEQDPLAQAQLQVDQTVSVLSQQGDPELEKVHVAVYYEALCPDSRSFFNKQLVPTYYKLWQHLQITLIPYGKATTRKKNNDYEFECQHGPIECQANIIHACSIEVIRNISLQLDYLSCMIKNNMQPIEVMETCAEKLGIKYDSILKCYMSPKGKELLAMYGEITNDLTPHVSFIPTVTLNGSSNDQANILKNLLQQVCLRFKVVPKECAL